ncbi:MAG: metallophosphoesterase [Phycisphaerae bacterium]
MSPDASDSAAASAPLARRRGVTRRALLRGALGVLGAGACGAAYAHLIEPYWLRVERVRLALPRLAPAFEGFRIAQLSDLHVDDERVARFVAHVIECTNGLAPDLVVITGDYITNGRREQLETVARLVRALATRAAVLAILGNHDYYDMYGWRRGGRLRGPIADDLGAALTNAGAIVLRNRRHVVRRDGAALQIVGLDDLMSPGYDPARAFVDVERGGPCIALSHNPDTIEDLARMPCDAILAGHTHGGQVRLPLIGAPMLPVKHVEYDAGLFRVGRQQLYVNRGIGHLWPVRFGCRPELTLFTLSAAGTA